MYNPAIARLTAPPVAIVQNWIDQYQGDRGPLIDMSQAVPGYPAHADLLAALGQHAASEDSLGYGAIEGEPCLRQAYADHMATLYGAAVNTDEVLITAGCNQAFITAAMAVAGAGDQVLMTRPNYFNHDSTLEMTGVTTGFVATSAEDGFIPDIAAIEAAITPQTRALALVSPNNPTGAIYPPEQLDAIAACCLKHNIWLILDETYRDFLPPAKEQQNGVHNPPHHLLQSAARERVILLYSFSKSYAIPGHRLGAVVAPRGSDYPDGKDHGQHPNLRAACSPARCCPDAHRPCPMAGGKRRPHATACRRLPQGLCRYYGLGDHIAGRLFCLCPPSGSGRQHDGCS